MELRLLPDASGGVPRSGAVESVQAGDLLLSESLSQIVDRSFLVRAGAEYWRFLTRVSLGLIRTVHDHDHQSVVLVARPLVLLRFRPPEYELLEDRGSITWRIERGILVSREGRGRGLLRLAVARLERPAAGCPVPVRVQVEVRSFYPWLRGGGRFARLGAWLYGQTQHRVHRFLARRFLRSLVGIACGSRPVCDPPGTGRPGRRR